MKKRILCMLMALTVLLGLLAGCASSDPLEEVELEKLTEGAGVDVDLGALMDDAVPLADLLAISTVLTTVASGTATKSDNKKSAVIDYSNARDGYVMAVWLAGGEARIKVVIKGPGGRTSQYDLRRDGKYEAYPLSDGSGTYNIYIYRNTGGTKYANVVSLSTDVKLVDEFAPFLHPNQYVYFTPESAAVKKAEELCTGVTDNLDKVSKIYDYVINNTTYDKQKAADAKAGKLSGYVPDVDDTLKTGKGVCFDYAALMSAMLRSQNVPVKLVVGYTSNVKHAWINTYSEKEGWIEAKIYFNGKEWKLMDPTFASNGKGRSDIAQYIGNGDNYTAQNLY